MAFLHRLKESFKEGLVTLTNAGDAPRRNDSHTRTLSKQSSKGKARSASVSFGFLESHIRDAIAAFVQDKIDKGEAKPHVFTQFWLQFPKLEAGFEVLRRQLEARTGSREGPLPLAVLQSAPRDFGIEEGSVMVRELCSKAATHKCTDIDFIGLVMLLLLAFTHFNSARKGKLDKREHDNTISFEDFLRGILQLVQDEFGDVSDGDDEAVGLEGAATAGGSGSGSATPSPPGEADGAAASVPSAQLDTDNSIWQQQQQQGFPFAETKVIGCLARLLARAPDIVPVHRQPSAC
ncbi:hypothetical protein VOLCADRAFT_87186 [Volvox carteri f. nagariensis]|uniref:Uncharacterized protein n=1 Tax=Volvox carteri f. nagariensis TaxID=3068 RepID=D8TKE4_VOLCA|nr:uncharacterized protein VOLCADRAFT_87186 [Volvox carteri f. nagariensis]EFJ52046.1 hypothetical protein VOLCADRAFT_87186 [Volvox carteri f. nagariensis]|eukprot:XP_002946820.1 hypothetical protein VOLCADRAFT_87186 [Volvox carteri f. nagariensis]